MRTRLVFLIMFMPSVVFAQPIPQETWGLCIGISEYQPDRLSLIWADKDATEFSTFLRYALGIPEDHYRILKNKEATAEKIIEQLGWLNMKARPGDRVYLFYSGHGKPESPIVPYDSVNELSLEMIKNSLRKIDSQDILFFADACYSGRLAGKGAKAVVESNGFTGLSKGLVIEMGHARANVVIMTSANGIQEALEDSDANGENVPQKKKNGFFTYYLMQGLMNPSQRAIVDQDGNGALTLYEVYEYVYRMVTHDLPQQPQISDPEKAKQIIVLTYAQPTPVPTATPILAPTAIPTPVPTPIPKLQLPTPIPSPTPELFLQIKTILIVDAEGKEVQPINDIYTVKVNTTVTIKVIMTVPSNHPIRVDWLARHGHVITKQANTATYQASKIEGDYVVIRIIDTHTGQSLEEPINLNIVP